MKVCLISCFRNNAGRVGRYFDQVCLLQQALTDAGDELSLVIGEGDSTDDTLALAKLVANWFHTEVVDCTHGGPEFGSVVDETRFRQLAHVGRCLWAAIPVEADVVLFVESDLIWEPWTMLGLLERLKEYPAVTPMVLFHQNLFYDVWAFRKNGQHFTQQPPYVEGWAMDGPMPVDSAGSCMAMKAELARKLVWDERVFPGICEQIYEQGGSVWIDPELKVWHG